MRKAATVCFAFICGLAFTLYAGVLPSLILAVLITAAVTVLKYRVNVLIFVVCAFYLGLAIMGICKNIRYETIKKIGNTEVIGYAKIKKCYSDSIYLAKVTANGKSFDTICTIYSKYGFSEGESLRGKIAFEYSEESENFCIANGAYLEAKITSYEVMEQSKISAFRSAVKKEAEKILFDYSGANAGSVSESMLFGDKSAMYPDTKDALYKDGIVHLLAVSGIHVSILIAVFSAVVSVTGMPYALKLAVIAAFSVFYAFLAGFTPSVCRASLMSMFALSENIFRRKCDPITVLMLLASLFCLIDPMIIGNVGFQLSYLATMGVIFGVKYFVKPLENRMRGSIFKAPVVVLIGGIYISLISCAMCLPALASSFGSAAVLTPLGNLICAPFAEILLVFDVLLFAISPVSPAARIVGTVCAALGNSFTSLSEMISAMAKSIDLSANIIPVVSGIYIAVYVMCDFYLTENKTLISLGFTVCSLLLAILI